MPTFTVDTHLFRELGELLVGRESTALVELIKNAYDADAKSVTVYGSSLSDPSQSIIRITDDGTGMSRAAFENGFLRIASRLKDEGNRRSAVFQRRYTGAKGVGRLAAHKLARALEVHTIAKSGTRLIPLTATIDWDLVETATTLDEVGGTGAIKITEGQPIRGNSGTTITLARLRRRWSTASHARFLEELQAFEPPSVLTEPLPKAVLKSRLLFSQPIVRDSSVKGGETFRVALEGELAPPDDYWLAAAEAADWVLEIRADRRTRKVRYSIAPTRRLQEEVPSAQQAHFEIKHPDPDSGPFFDARILVRAGAAHGGRKKDLKAWLSRSAGVRVFMEGFRVLPYGEPANDWLSLDRDAGQRDRDLLIRRAAGGPFARLLNEDSRDAEEGLLLLPNKHYFGAVFLTHTGAPDLRMLVNREGFIPDDQYYTLVDLVRGGIDLATRVRAHASAQIRHDRREKRVVSKADANAEDLPTTIHLRQHAAQAVAAVEAVRAAMAAGDVNRATRKLMDAAGEVGSLDRIAADVAAERSMFRILASVGTQLSAFVHEINAVLGMAIAVEEALGKLRASDSVVGANRKKLVEVFTAATELRKYLERQASYLVDIVSVDATRRRSRQPIADRFERAKQLLKTVADSREIAIKSTIPADLRTPPMYSAEVVTVFSNLLSNAIKAAGSAGTVEAIGKRTSDGRVVIRIQNTGVAVDPEDGERWFRPFASTTSKVEAPLGQGMGLGLTITRYVLEEYGAEIHFVRPGRHFATAIEVTFTQ